MCEVAHEVLGELGGVRADAIEEARLAPPHERQAEGVEAGNGEDATVVNEPTLVIEELRFEPRVARSESGGPHNRVDRAQIGFEQRRHGTGRCRPRRVAQLGIQTMRCCVLVESIEQSALLQVCRGAHVCERAGELGEVTAPADEPPGEYYTVCGDGREVEVTALG